MSKTSTVLVLAECEPFAGETEETIHYRRCDVCFSSACDDIWAGKLDQADWRRFYLLPDGTCVCEHCIDKVEP